jgi:serine/threonine protein kinase
MAREVRKSKGRSVTTILDSNSQPQTNAPGNPNLIPHRLPDTAARETLASGRAVEVLGEGGTAIVYQIWNEQLSIKRAVKLMKPNASRESHARFNQEMKILAQLSHPNIINVHSVGKWNGLPYLEMDYVDGPSLEDLLEQKDRLPLVVSIAIAIEVAKALDYTHRHRYRINNVEYHGLLHRDLKPGNILLPRYDTVRLSDFGIATLSTVSTTSMTRTGKIIGSMQYLAPEQLEDKSVDHRSDIYSFGAVLYELVTGEKLFSERNVSKLVRMRVKNEITPLSDHGLKLPHELEKLINSAISVNPSDRPASMKKVLTVLEQLYPLFRERPTEEVISRYLNGESVGSKIKGRQKMGTQSPLRLLVVGGFLSMLLVFGFFLSGLYWYGTKKNPGFFDEIRSVLQQPDPIDIEAMPGESVKVDVVVNKMSGDEKSKSPRKSVKRSTKKAVKVIPEKVPQTGDFAADTISVLDLQLNRLNTSDTLFALRELDRTGEYTKVLALIPYLSAQMQRSRVTQIMKHRAVVGLGQEKKSYYDNNHISDGEYYLAKGLYLFNQGQYQRAIWIFRVAQTTPAALLDSDELSQEVLYFTALAETELYNVHPTAQRLETTVASWNSVEEFMKNRPRNPYYQRAVQELQRLSEES